MVTGLAEMYGQEKILVVDDEPSNLKLIEKMLRAQGYQHLLLVQHSLTVLDHYRSFRPDLILLDINMPQLDGHAVLERLRALDDPMMPPVVMLTAQQGRDHLLRALRVGARDYILKPFDHNELLMRVRNLLDAQLAHRFMHNQKSVLERMVREQTRELRSTRLQVVQRLGMAAEYRDEETGNHILRMSHTCALLARTAGWSEQQVELILHASPMHDIGKIGIPDAILLKPGRLDSDELAVMRGHAEIGGRLLDGDASPLMRMARDIALYHHEKWDGSGYPRGLSGETIPQSARIAAISDVFDALMSDRPYKKAWPLERALGFIREQAGSHFDMELVEHFMMNLEEILEIRRAYSEPP